ncbi:MAG: hypothetical protein Q9168_003486 [Polycauliona sp. 1 TL-2023]
MSRDHQETQDPHPQLARFTTEEGRIGFAIRIPNDTGVLADAEGIDLANIYNYVTPAELERYEHREIELEDEREAKRPKVGRPRKGSPGLIISTEIMGEQIKIKKPLGRPRKRPRVSDQERPRLFFAGVQIPSPVKAEKPTSSTASELASRDLSQPVYRNGSPADGGPEGISGIEDTGIRIDQLTPSNAKRVIGAPQPGIGQRAHRPSYSMVKAALSESESNTEDDLPQSPSEDELSAVIPTIQHRRFSTVAEVAESVSSETQDPITISSSSASPRDRDRSSRGDNGDVKMMFDEYKAVDDESYDHDRLLQQFQANNSRRLPSGSPNPAKQPSKSSRIPLTKLAEKPSYRHSNSASTRPQTTPTRSRYIRQSMTPHFPSATQSQGKTIKSRARGGATVESLGSPTIRMGRRHAPTSSATNEITLGSQETLSSDDDRRQIHDAIHSYKPTHNSDADAPGLGRGTEITLGSSIPSSSSDESNHDVEMTEEPTTDGHQDSVEGMTTTVATPPSRNTMASRWFGGMPWR